MPFGKLFLRCKQCIYCWSDYVWKLSADLKQLHWKEMWGEFRGDRTLKEPEEEKTKETFLPNTCRLRLECVLLLGASGKTGKEVLRWANATNFIWQGNLPLKPVKAWLCQEFEGSYYFQNISWLKIYLQRFFNNPVKFLAVVMFSNFWTSASNGREFVFNNSEIGLCLYSCTLGGWREFLILYVFLV